MEMDRQTDMKTERPSAWPVWRHLVSLDAAGGFCPPPPALTAVNLISYEGLYLPSV